MCTLGFFDSGVKVKGRFKVSSHHLLSNLNIIEQSMIWTKLWEIVSTSDPLAELKTVFPYCKSKLLFKIFTHFINLFLKNHMSIEISDNSTEVPHILPSVSTCDYILHNNDTIFKSENWHWIWLHAFSCMSVYLK